MLIWGTPCAGFGWIFPLIGLIFMAVMIFLCARMMRGRVHGCGMCGCRIEGSSSMKALQEGSGAGAGAKP